MATTALKIVKDEVEQRLLFCTVQKEKGVDVDVFLADEDFLPMGRTSLSVSEMDEPEYHIKLRKEASEKGHFVSEYSTDPEWNPGYKPEEHGELSSDMH